MDDAIIGWHIVQKYHDAPRITLISQSKKYARKHFSHTKNGPIYIPKVLMLIK
jgi:hypothetical protein